MISARGKRKTPERALRRFDGMHQQTRAQCDHRRKSGIPDVKQQQGFEPDAITCTAVIRCSMRDAGEDLQPFDEMQRQGLNQM